MKNITAKIEDLLSDLEHLTRIDFNYTNIDQFNSYDSIDDAIEQIKKKVVNTPDREIKNLIEFVKIFPNWIPLFLAARTISVHESNDQIRNVFGIDIRIYGEVYINNESKIREVKYLHVNFDVFQSGRRDIVMYPRIIYLEKDTTIIILPDIVHNARVTSYTDAEKREIEKLRQQILEKLSSDVKASLRINFDKALIKTLKKQFQKQIADLEKKVHAELKNYYIRKINSIVKMYKSALENIKNEIINESIQMIQKLSKYGYVYSANELPFIHDSYNKYRPFIVLKLRKPIIPIKMIYDDKLYRLKQEFLDDMDKYMEKIGFHYDELIYSLDEGVWKFAKGYSPHIEDCDTTKNAKNGIYSKLCTGDKDYKLDEIDQLIESLKVINMNSVYWGRFNEYKDYFEEVKDIDSSIWE
jgi:uncharacterized protein YnzC (UPF0291/DUF896 family)